MFDFADLDHVLIFFSCFLSICLLFKRTLSVWLSLGAFTAACLFIWGDGHFLIAKLTLPPDRNPQIATVALYCFTTLCLMGRLALKRWRSLDRLMVCFAAISVLLTGVLFHTILIQRTLPAWAKDAAWGNSYLVSVPITEFQSHCAAARLTCWNGPSLDLEKIDTSIREQVAGIYNFYRDNKPAETVGHGFGAFNDLSPNGVSVVLYHQSGEDIRVIEDSRTGGRIHSFVRDAFYLLCTVAHSIWLFGSLFLIAFHKARFRARATVSAD